MVNNGENKMLKIAEIRPEKGIINKEEYFDYYTIHGIITKNIFPTFYKIYTWFKGE
jgi:hypothetical protein